MTVARAFYRRRRFMSVGLGVILCGLVVGCERVGVVELEFDSEESVENAIDKGWLPAWFPRSTRSAHGAQETFDSSFIWISLRLDEELRSRVQTHCDSLDSRSADVPAEEFMARFPTAVIAEHSLVLAKTMSHYECENDRKRFRIALDETDTAAYLWAD